MAEAAVRSYVLDAPEPAGTPVAPEDAAVLDRLRTLAMRSRLAPRLDAEGACRLMQARPDDGADAYAAALLRLLPLALGRRVVLHRPGCRSATFDEAWLLRLLRSLVGGDAASAHFAIASRARRQFRRPVAFLAQGLAARLDPVAEPVI